MQDKEQSSLNRVESRALRKLLSQAYDGDITETVQQQIETALAGNEAACTEYADFVALEALLEQRFARSQLAQGDLQAGNTLGDDQNDADLLRVLKEFAGKESVALGEEQRETKQNALGATQKSTSKKFATVNRHTGSNSSQSAGINSRALLAIAASLVLLAGIWFSRGGSHASIVAIEDATWRDGRSYEIGDSLGDEWVELEQGTIRFAFESKALVSLRGPARFRALSSLEAQLELGTATAHVPESAVGFKIYSPDITVIDLGTGFELSVKDGGGSRVHVVEGRVRVDSDADSAELSAGQLASCDATDADSAAIVVEESSSLEPKTRGSLSYNPEHPLSLGYRRYVDDAKVHVFLENAFHTLPGDVRVHHTRPGNYKSLELPRSTLSAGTQVHSYLLHYSPNSGRRIVRGAVTFPGKILGIIGDTDMLNATNAVLGSPWTLQCTHAERGIESTPDPNSDTVTLSSDMRTLTVNMRTESIDQIRVLVDCSQ